MSDAGRNWGHRFGAMGVEIELALVGGRRAAAWLAGRRVERLADEWNRIFSRFDPGSELSRLNRAAGTPHSVSPRLFDAVKAAVAGAEMTGGLFDPTILPALVALGYDRTFSQLAAVSGAPLPEPVRSPGCAGIVVDRATRSVMLPRGVQLDLGGIAKGLFADAAAALLSDWEGAIVSAAGDLRVVGQPAGGGPWIVGVEHPERPDLDVATIALDQGGVATSGVNRRTWQRGGSQVHHIVDPRTGDAARSDIVTATVVAPSTALAEVVSTAVVVGGREVLDRPDLQRAFSLAVLVRTGLEVELVHGGAKDIDHGDQPAVA